MRYLGLIWLLLLTACNSMDALKARLEAEPNCKPQLHKVTGAVMPCLSTDTPTQAKAGKAPPIDVQASNPSKPLGAVSASPAVPPVSASPSIGAPNAKPAGEVFCKPQMHKKLGVVIPCPNG